MASYTVSFGGQQNGAGATDALFLKKFAGEVLGAFATANRFLQRTMNRSIENGKSAQ